MIIINISYSDWHLINAIINGTTEAKAHKNNNNNYYVTHKVYKYAILIAFLYLTPWQIITFALACVAGAWK